MDSWTWFCCGIVVGYIVIVICGAIMSWRDAISSRRKAMVALLEGRILFLKNANRRLRERNEALMDELEVRDNARLFVAKVYEPRPHNLVAGYLFDSRDEAELFYSSAFPKQFEYVTVVERLPKLSVADGSTSSEESEGA